jgi:hypothetical protein
LVVHYTNRYTLEFPVLYGQDVLDCQSVPAATPGGQGPTVAWRGPANPPLPQAAELALFESVWRNPLPFQVESVDYVSSQAGSAPLLMGLTLECIPRAP